MLTLLKNKKILFLPDQHLGRNTAAKKGIPLEEMIVWNPFKPLGGNTEKQIKNAKIILWQGHCSVHTRFTVKQIEKAKIEHPDIKVIAHPECTLDVVNAADFSGSTEFIKDKINDSAAGSTWAVGTEISLVNRIAAENPDKNIFCLDPVVCPCSTMYMIHPKFLLDVLEQISAGNIPNQILVKEFII